MLMLVPLILLGQLLFLAACPSSPQTMQLGRPFSLSWATSGSKFYAYFKSFNSIGIIRLNTYMFIVLNILYLSKLWLHKEFC
jgi:hypothetical protein